MRDMPLQNHAARARIAALRVRSRIRAALPPGIRRDDPHTRTILYAVMVAGAYGLGALIGLSVRFQSSPISPIWPPNAILLVALLLAPVRTWWICLLAVCGAHMLVELPGGVPLGTAAGLYFTNSAEAVVGALGVRHFIGGPPWLGSLRRVTIYLACAVVAAPVLTSFADAALVVLTGWGGDYWLTWRTRCVSNSMAELTIGPALLLGLTRAPIWIRGAARRRCAEAALLAAGLFLVGATAFGGRIAWGSAGLAPMYAVLPFLLWAAIRFGVGGTSASLLGITVLATWGAIRGGGPFSDASPANEVVSLQMFLIGISAPMLLLAALMQEREDTRATLRESEERYRGLVESQTEMICRYLPDTTLTFVNEAFCRAYGRPREELVGRRFLHLMDGPAREHHLRRIAALLEHPHTSMDEHEVVLPDGAIGWQQWVDHAIRDAHGRVVEFQSIGRDITERKRVEEALRVSEARFRAAFESAATGMMLVGVDGRPVRVNRPLVEMLGYSEEELRAHSFADLTYPDDLGANMERFRRALAGEIEGYQLEKRFIHKRGHVIWGLLSAGVVRDAAGHPLFLVGQVQDITEHKRAEAALRESEERYRAVVTNFPHGAVLLFGQDLRHLFADGRGLREMGLSRKSVEGKTIWEVFPANLCATLAPRYWATLGGAHATFDLIHAGKTYQMQMLPIQYAGATAGMVVIQDVTEQRRARDELERERTQAVFFSALSRELRTLIEHSPDAISRFDLDLRKRYVNPAAEALLGISAAEQMGKTYAELGLSGAVYGPWEQALRAVFATGKPQALDGEFTTPHGRLLMVHVRYIPEFASDGRVESVLGITSDITDLKRAEEALRTAKAAAEAARRREEQRRGEAERREQIAGSLREVLAILNSNRSLTEILQYIARQAGHLLGSDAAAIYTTDGAADAAADTAADAAADAAHGALELMAAYGLPPYQSPDGDERPLAKDHAALGRAMAERRPVVVLGVPDAAPARAGAGGQDDGKAGHAGGAKGEGSAATAEPAAEYILLRAAPLPAPYRALLAVPIVAQDEAYGGLLLLYSGPRRFSAEEVALATAYCDQVALAIANARLQRHIRRAAIEAERNRLARDLHDTVTQEIFSASLMAEAIPRIWEHHRDEAAQSLRQLHEITRGSLAALRALLMELRPAVLEEKALADLLRQLCGAMKNRSGVPIAVAVADDCPRIPTEVKLAFYRIAQESLMNAAKHADARHIAVRVRSLRSGGAIRLEVVDDGMGFEMGAVPEGHFGIGVMRERALSVGATLRIRSRRGRGTQVIVEWQAGMPTEEATVGRERAAREGGARQEPHG